MADAATDHDHPVHEHAAEADAHRHAAQHHAERADRHPAVIVALDESPASSSALDFALSSLLAGDDLYLLSVLPPLAAAAASGPVVAPIVTSAGMAAAARSWDEQRSIDEKAAKALLRAAARKAIARGVVPRQNVHAHVLPAAGGASGVAASVTAFVTARHGGGDENDKEAGAGVALVVVGTRGMGAAKSLAMGALGLGSVSDYVLLRAPVPVAVVPAAAAAAPAATTTTTTARPVVVIAADESPHSSDALAWAAARGLVSPSASVRVATAASPVPFPAMMDESAAGAALEARSWADSSEAATAYAQEVADRAAARAKSLLLRGGADGQDEAALDVRALVLRGGGGGPADAGAAVQAYAAEQGASAVVVGSRGMSALKRALAGLVGLGSVSLYLAHHATCPVVVVPHRPAAAQAHAGAAAEAKKEGKQD